MPGDLGTGRALLVTVDGFVDCQGNPREQVGLCGSDPGFSCKVPVADHVLKVSSSFCTHCGLALQLFNFRERLSYSCKVVKVRPGCDESSAVITCCALCWDTLPLRWKWQGLQAAPCEACTHSCQLAPGGCTVLEKRKTPLNYGVKKGYWPRQDITCAAVGAPNLCSSNKAFGHRHCSDCCGAA